MRITNHFKKPIAASLAALAILAGSVQAATVIYSHNFGGSSTTNLNGVAVDVRPGSQTWTAGTAIKANGSYGGAATAGAFLPFAPAQGAIYQLDVSMVGVATNWSAIGFSNGLTATSGMNNGGAGKAWMYWGGAVGESFLRNSTNAANTQSAYGGAGQPLNVDSPTIDLRIILDTTDGASLWTAAWYAKRAADPAYTMVRAETGAMHESITQVGFSKNSTAVGDLQSFTLTQIPEPGAALLGGLCMLALLRRRRSA